MKKIFAFAGLMTAAVISLTNCQPKELGTEILPGKTFTLSASTQIDTRTTNDGMSTLWETKDTVNVFYGSTAAKGTVVEGGSTLATFEVDGTAPASATDWYVFFPYNKHMESPDGSTGYNYIGHSKGLNQERFDSMASLRGNVCPMYGVAKGQTADEALITMKQLASVIEFNLTNSTGSTITVNSITYTASEDIVGSYYIKFDDGEPEYIPSGDSYVYKDATVNLKNGDLASGASGKAYLPIKPYTQKGAVKVVVTCTVGDVLNTATFDLTPTGDQAVFTAGKIKKVTLNITSLTPKSDSIADAHAAASGTEVILRDVLVSSVMKQGFFITDNTDVLFVFLKAAPSVTVGQKVTVEGKISKYQGNKQVNNDPAPTITATGTGKVTLSPVTYTGKDVDAAYVDNNAKYVTVTATGLTTTTASVDGAERILYIGNNNRVDGVTIAKDKTYTLTGYVYGHGTYSGKEQVYFYAESAVEQGGTVEANLSVSSTSVSIEQAGGTAEVTVTCDNTNWTIENTAEWLTATKSGDKVTFSASANTETKRTATVTIKHSNGELTKTVKVSQEGAVETDLLNLSAASISFGSKDNDPIVVNVSCNNANWTIDQTTVPSWLTVTPDTQSDPMTITVVAQDNPGEARNAEIVVNHSNGEISRTLKVGQNAHSSGGTAKYVKITSTSALTDGQYIIVYEEGAVAMNGGATLLDAASNNKSVTISGGSITWDGDDIYFTYNSSEQSLLGVGGAYLAHSQAANNIANVTEYDEASCKLDISFDGDGNVIIAPPTGYNLRYNATSGQERFRFYKATSSQKLIQLYKKQ